MAPDKSLAAEIEAVTSLQTSIEAVRRVMDALPLECVASDTCPVDDLMHALTTMQLVEREIAALQSRAFEDGARWMRDQAAEKAGTVHEWIPEECALEPIEAIWEEIRSLPLQPEGERNA